MHRLFLSITLTLAQLCLPVLTAVAADNSSSDSAWELKRSSDGIEVYTRSVDSSPYDAVRSTTVMEGIRLSSMVALIMDPEACPQWVDTCAESYVHEKISDTNFLIYTHNAMPFPVTDRDLLSNVQWSQDPDTLEVQMKSEATTGILAKKKGKLRLTNASVSWSLRPLANGTIEVINEAHIEPGSSLPGWLTNMLLVGTPFETLKGFRQTLTGPKYRDAVIPFVKEPEI